MDVDGLNGVDENVEVDLEEEVERPRSRIVTGGPCRTEASSRAWSGKVDEAFNGNLGKSPLPFEAGRRAREVSSTGEASCLCRVSVDEWKEPLLITRSLAASDGLCRRFVIWGA